MLTGRKPSIYDLEFEFPKFASNLIASENETGYSLSMDLPGVRPENIKISVDTDGCLEVIAENNTSDKKRSYHHLYKLPKNVDHDSFKVKCEFGVLTIEMLKKTTVPNKKYLDVIFS